MDLPIPRIERSEPGEAFSSPVVPYNMDEENVKKNIAGACEVLLHIEKQRSSHSVAIDHSSHSSNTQSKVVRDGKLSKIFYPTPRKTTYHDSAFMSKDEDNNDNDDDEEEDEDEDDYDGDYLYSTTVTSTIFHPRSSININNNALLLTQPRSTTQVSRSIASFVNERLKGIKEKCRWMDGTTPIVDECRPPSIPISLSSSISLPSSPRMGRSPLLSPLLSRAPSRASSCFNSRSNSPVVSHDTKNETVLPVRPLIPRLPLSSIGQSVPSPSSFLHHGDTSSPLSSRTTVVPPLERRLSRSTFPHPSQPTTSSSVVPNSRVDFIRSVRSHDLASLDGSMSQRTTSPLRNSSSSILSSPRGGGRSPYLTPLNISPAPSTFHSRVNSRATSPTPAIISTSNILERLTSTSPDASTMILRSTNHPQRIHNQDITSSKIVHETS